MFDQGTWVPECRDDRRLPGVAGLSDGDRAEPRVDGDRGVANDRIADGEQTIHARQAMEHAIVQPHHRRWNDGGGLGGGPVGRLGDDVDQVEKRCGRHGPVAGNRQRDAARIAPRRQQGPVLAAGGSHGRHAGRQIVEQTERVMRRERVIAGRGRHDRPLPAGVRQQDDVGRKDGADACNQPLRPIGATGLGAVVQRRRRERVRLLFGHDSKTRIATRAHWAGFRGTPRVR